jgi:hypothetical protein
MIVVVVVAMMRVSRSACVYFHASSCLYTVVVLVVKLYDEKKLFPIQSVVLARLFFVLLL